MRQANKETGLKPSLDIANFKLPQENSNKKLSYAKVTSIDLVGSGHKDSQKRQNIDEKLK